MNGNRITPDEANELLRRLDFTELQRRLKDFPFGDFLQALWISPDYQPHGKAVQRVMEALLSRDLTAVLADPTAPLGYRASRAQCDRLTGAISDIRAKIFPQWDSETEALFRIAALYHDIGKYIIKDRHPTLGWHIVQYLDPEEKVKLRQLLGNNEERFRLFMIILRDHDEFGVISTGEASAPILLRAAESVQDPDSQKQVISALFLFTLADMAGIPKLRLNGKDTDKLIVDWEQFLAALDYCSENRINLDEYVIQQAGETRNVCERIRRLLTESSREYPSRYVELDDLQFIEDQLQTVFSSKNARDEFATLFTHVCKLDYGKRFFEVLIEYSERPGAQDPTNGRMTKEDVVYAALAILKRITTTYAAMIRSDSSSGNLIGVELKDLKPETAPEKATRILELIISSHYPGLSWMMSDTPAWYF